MSYLFFFSFRIIPSLYKKYRIEYKVGFYYTVKQQKSMYDFTEA